MPDNYQEDRRTSSRTARRRPTSACSCSSTLAAYDFGYLGVTELLDRLEPTFDTLLRMPRYRGHFYNWYDTDDARAAAAGLHLHGRQRQPGRVSPDASSGLSQIVRIAPIVDAARRSTGIGDVLRLFEESLDGASAAAPRRSAACARSSTQLRTARASRPATLRDWRALLDRLGDRLAALGVLLHEIEESLGASPTRRRRLWPRPACWLERAGAAVSERQAELERLRRGSTRDRAIRRRRRPGLAAGRRALADSIALVRPSGSTPGRSR